MAIWTARTARLALACAALWLGTDGPAVAGDPGGPPPVAERPGPPSDASIAGTVTRVLQVRELTYLELDTGKARIWVAGPRTEVAVGDGVALPSGISLVDFHSAALQRTFDSIQLVDSIRVEPKGAAAARERETGPAQGAHSDGASLEDEGGAPATAE